MIKIHPPIHTCRDEESSRKELTSFLPEKCFFHFDILFPWPFCLQIFHFDQRMRCTIEKIPL